jgi:hypothetical protein
MKILLIATLLMTMSAYADQKEENVATVKASILANIDQRISQMQAHKSCVSGASDHDQLKACRESNKEAMKKLHAENKGEREQWKAGKNERREKRREEKKATKSN